MQLMTAVMASMDTWIDRGYVISNTSAFPTMVIWCENAL